MRTRGYFSKANWCPRGKKKVWGNSRIDSSEITVQKSSCRLSIKSKSWLLRYLSNSHCPGTVKIAGTCTATQTMHITNTHKKNLAVLDTFVIKQQCPNAHCHRKSLLRPLVGVATRELVVLCFAELCMPLFFQFIKQVGWMRSDMWCQSGLRGRAD